MAYSAEELAAALLHKVRSNRPVPRANVEEPAEQGDLEEPMEMEINTGGQELEEEKEEEPRDSREFIRDENTGRCYGGYQSEDTYIKENR